MSNKVQVELTAKKWKGGWVIASLIMIAGLILAVIAAGHDSQPWMWVGVGIIILGLFIKKICRIGAWWTNR